LAGESIDLEVLRAAIVARGMSQREFAEHAGIDHTTLSKILSGKRGCSVQFARKILQACPEIPPDRFLRLRKSS